MEKAFSNFEVYLFFLVRDGSLFMGMTGSDKK